MQCCYVCHPQQLLTGTTPGPWRCTNAAYRYHSPDKHAAAYWIIEGGTGLNGTTLPLSGARTNVRVPAGLSIKGYFGEANARLIAAAPELAQALIAAYARIAELERIVNGNHTGYNNRPTGSYNATTLPAGE